MFTKVRCFLSKYWLLSFTILAAIIAGICTTLGLLTIAHWILAIATITAVMVWLWDITQTVREGHYGINIITIIAALTAIIVHVYWAGIALAIALACNDIVIDFATRHTRKVLTQFLRYAPSQAHIMRGRKVLDVPAGHVRSGDKLSIYPNEIVPADAEVLSGTSMFDEQILTGNKTPVEHSTGDTTLSGSINTGDTVVVRALCNAKDSQYHHLAKMLQHSIESRSPFARLTSSYSLPFTVIAFALAGFIWVLTGDAKRFLEVLIVASPVPLFVSAPLAFASGLSRASTHGIFMKTSTVMEHLAQLGTVGFDTFGTLTKGDLSLRKIYSYAHFSGQDVLRFAASLLQNSDSPFTAVAVNTAKKQNIKLAKVKASKDEAGGITGRVDRHNVTIGTWAFVQNIAANGEITKKQLPKETALFLLVDGALAGALSFEDTLQSNAKTAVRHIDHSLNTPVFLLSSDREDVAHNFAKKLGTKNVQAQMTLAEKLRFIETLPARPNGFVGRINESAPLIATADVGIALNARSGNSAIDAADVFIMNTDIQQVATVFDISRNSYRTAKRGILIGMLISFGFMILFASGRLSAVYGAVLQELAGLVAIILTLKVSGQKTSSKKDSAKRLASSEVRA